MQPLGRTEICFRPSIVRRPGLLDYATVAQGDLGARPAFDRCIERRLGQQEVVYARLSAR